MAFGWLVVAPTDANSDDPISIATQEITKLNNSVNDLSYKDELIRLIDIAEEKYDLAVSARDSKNAAIEAYNNALQVEETALEEKNSAQLAVDNQTALVATALSEKNTAQDDLDIANINLQTTQATVQNAGNQGVSFRIYPLSRNGNTAYLSPYAGLMCQGALPYFYTYAGDGRICGLSENIIGIFTATLTVPAGINDIYFAAYTDDGSKIYVDGVLEASQWQEQGSTWGPYTRHFDTSVDKTLELEVWWYNGGGPGLMNIGWGHSGIWTGIPSSYLSYGSGATQSQINAYNEALSTQQTAQTNYNNKLSIYNAEVVTLNTYSQTLQTKITAYDNAVINTANNLEYKNNAEIGYNNQINDLNNAIENAWDYYNTQKEREIQIAIAQAAANAAANQPTPEPTIIVDPTPEPTPEVSPEPTPEPTPEVTPDPEPTIDPTPEPTPEPTVEPTTEPTVDPTPEPTPGPEPTVEPTTEPTTNPEIKDEELAALIPEKGTGTAEDLSGVIANLTSKDNKLVNLSPEQVAAVSKTLKSLTQEAKAEIAGDLGISAGEVAKIADQMKSNPALAEAFVEFSERAGEAGDTQMPFTLADAVTEVQTEAFLSDPLGAVFDVNPLELLSNFSELGMDMTDDQREKAQEVIIPVVIVSQIASTLIGMRR